MENNSESNCIYQLPIIEYILFDSYNMRMENTPISKVQTTRVYKKNTMSGSIP